MRLMVNMKIRIQTQFVLLSIKSNEEPTNFSIDVSNPMMEVFVSYQALPNPLKKNCQYYESSNVRYAKAHQLKIGSWKTTRHEHRQA